MKINKRIAGVGTMYDNYVNFKVMKIIKLFLVLIFLLPLCSCKSEEQKYCEEKIKEKTYKYESTCKCVIKSLEKNNIQEFDDIKDFFNKATIINKKGLEKLLRSSIFGFGGGQRKLFINSIVDISTFCPPIRDEDISSYLLTKKGEVVSEIDGFSLIFNKTESENYKVFFKNGLYRGDTLYDLPSFLYEATKNITIKNQFKEAANQENKDILEKWDKKMDTKSKNLLLSIFNNNYVKMLKYYKGYKGYDDEKANDFARFQAYLSFVKIMNDNFFGKYSKNLSEIYNDKYDDENIFVFAKEHKYI